MPGHCLSRLARLAHFSACQVPAASIRRVYSELRLLSNHGQSRTPAHVSLARRNIKILNQNEHYLALLNIQQQGQRNGPFKMVQKL
jgi:hypothetical protein